MSGCFTIRPEIYTQVADDKWGKTIMTAEQFIAIWKDNKLTERGGALAHFDDLCDLLGVDKPRDPDIQRRL